MINGNVDTLVQDFGYGQSGGILNAMNTSGNRFKKIVYDYDLVSGKVNQVSYQPGQPDAYYHKYSYDAENRLTDVYTGRDCTMLLLWNLVEQRTKIKLNHFYLNLDDDLLKFPESTRDTSMEVISNLKTENGAIQFCVGYHENENCYQKIK